MVDNKLNMNKEITKREAVKAVRAITIDNLVKEDLKESYELLDNVENRLDLLEEKFYAKYLHEDYIIFEATSKVILGAQSKLLHYTLNNLCDVMCTDKADMGTLGKDTHTTVIYNDKEYKIPVQVLPDVENIVKRINILLSQSDCTVYDIDYYERTKKYKADNTHDYSGVSNGYILKYLITKRTSITLISLLVPASILSIGLMLNTLPSIMTTIIIALGIYNIINNLLTKWGIKLRR